MPFNLSFTHLLVVAIVGLVVLGPERLPGAARAAGNLYREYKRVSGGLQAEVRDVFADLAEPFNDVITDLRGGGSDDDAPAPAESPPAVSPLAPAIPALGPSTGLVSPGPSITLDIPSLGAPPQPGTVVARQEVVHEHAPHGGAPPSP